MNFPTKSAAIDKASEDPTQIAPMPNQNGVGYMAINNAFGLNNQLPSVKKSECKKLNIALKSTIPQTDKPIIAISIIRPDHIKARPNALRPHKTKSKMQKAIAPTPQIPKAIRTLAKND